MGRAHSRIKTRTVLSAWRRPSGGPLYRCRLAGCAPTASTAAAGPAECLRRARRSTGSRTGPDATLPDFPQTTLAADPGRALPGYLVDFPAAGTSTGFADQGRVASFPEYGPVRLPAGHGSSCDGKAGRDDPDRNTRPRSWRGRGDAAAEATGSWRKSTAGGLCSGLACNWSIPPVRSLRAQALPGAISPALPGWRRKRDSNPRGPFEPCGFQDRRLQPLGHSSVSISLAADWFLPRADSAVRWLPANSNGIV